MKNAQTHQWAEWLRTTSYRQAMSTMYDPDTWQFGASEAAEGMCCLGVGAYESGTCADKAILMRKSLPDGPFFRWLGFDPTLPWDVVTETDVMIDWDPDEYPYPTDDDTNLMRVGVSASWLNDDAHLTFSQIADVIDFFGVALPEKFGYSVERIHGSGLLHNQRTMREIIAREAAHAAT